MVKVSSIIQARELAGQEVNLHNKTQLRRFHINIFPTIEYFLDIFILKYFLLLEDTARYAGLLLAPAEGFGRGRGFFCPSAKRAYAVLAHFWQFLVPSSNLGNF